MAVHPVLRNTMEIPTTVILFHIYVASYSITTFDSFMKLHIFEQIRPPEVDLSFPYLFNAS